MGKYPISNVQSCRAGQATNLFRLSGMPNFEIKSGIEK
jgi:hypothetical protein